MKNVLQDLRFALRQMPVLPVSPSPPLLTLALAIGANAVVFSITNAFILPPTRLPEPVQQSRVSLLCPDEVPA